ncbi:hypothetical protein [Pseudalkalibacillus decolorationis]|uniref:hypothetical protein n=1 Tax=Pseudalkalibacillus decolorationis TaxID=163879 RepID=UPI002147BB6E|nr:hypothetical protein [Pseudalkalibacillus decolorationis]
MKSVITGVLAVLIAGGAATYIIANNEPAKEEGEKVETVSNEETTATEQVTIEPPTERTLTAPKSRHPWKNFKREEIQAEIDKGGQVFLFEDGKVLEKGALGVKNTPNTKEFTQGNAENLTIDMVANGWAETIRMYVLDLKEYYPDKEEYFNKLNEVAVALESQNFTTVDTKIKEAKTLRVQ